MNDAAVLQARIDAALQVARDIGTVDGDHHKTYAIDQMVQALTGDDYYAWVGRVHMEDEICWERGRAP